MSDDREIRKIFTRARQADRSEAPPYERLRQAAQERPGRPARGRRLFLPAAFGTLAAGALVVLAAIPLVWREAPTIVIDDAPAPISPVPAEPEPAKALPPAQAGDSRLRDTRDNNRIAGPAAAPAASAQDHGDKARDAGPPPSSAPSRAKSASQEEVLVGTGAAPRRESSLITGVKVDERPRQDQPAQTPEYVDTDGDGLPNVHGARETGLRVRLDKGASGRILKQDLIQEIDGTAQRSNKDEGTVGGVVGGVLGGMPGDVAAGMPLRRMAEEPARLKALGYVGPDAESLPAPPPFNTESYAPLPENPFQRVTDTPVSTFSVDVDTASYSMVRRFLVGGALPPPDAVRIEEMINYFPYHDAPPRGRDPFSVHTEIASCPWAPGHRLARIALKGREVSREETPGSNLVFLVDVSGSMDEPNKLPLVQGSLAKLAHQLDGRDEVSIVVYAGSSGLVLPPTRGSSKREILAALENLRAGGSTNGGEGLRLAYATARRRFVEGGINRVILATDGDFNVGITDHGELIRFVEDQARTGIFLTVLGFGMGNYKDDRLEQLADRGNGNYAYIDSPREAHKALVEQIGGTLVTIAQDVKIQVEFNPSEVGAYRLIGYENRLLRREDFNDDRKDAGEIGSGHTVTALYEIVPAGEPVRLPSVDPLKYQSAPRDAGAASSGEAFTVKLRYKEPGAGRSRLIEHPVTDARSGIRGASGDLRFAAAVAAFGMILRDSSHKGIARYELVRSLAEDALGEDEGGYRREFLSLVRAAASLQAD